MSSSSDGVALDDVQSIATLEGYRRRIDDLEAQLREAQETLDAIRTGEVDAVVVGDPSGDAQIYTLRNADRPYRVLIERMREGAVTLNHEGVVLYCNRALVDLLGTPPDHVVGHPLRRHLGPGGPQASAFDRLLERGDGKGEFAIAGAGGRSVPVQVSLSTLPADEGEHAVVCAIFTDLTEEKRQAAELAEAQARLAAEAARAEGEGFARLILDSATDFAIIATDTARRITTWNSGAEKIFGWAADEVLGQPMPRIWTPEDRRTGAPEAEMRGALERGQAEDERWHLRRDGSSFWANGLMMPLRGREDRHIGFLKILRDRTEARLAEQVRVSAAHQLGALVETQRAVDRAGADLSAVMDAVVHGALTILPRADGAVIEMREGDAIVYRAAAGTSAAHLGLRLKIEGSFSGHCLMQGRPLLCADTEVEDRVDRDACHKVGITAMLAVPVPHHGEYVAVLKVHSEQAGAFLEADIPIAQLLVGALAAGLSGVAEAEAAAALRASEERLRFAQEAGGIGTFELDLAKGSVETSDTFRRLWGIDQPELPLHALAELVLPDDRERIGSLRGDIGPDALAYTEYRIRRPDTGDVRWIARRGEIINDSRGRPARGFGIVYDITEQKAREASLADLNATLEQRVAERTADRDRMWRLSSDVMVVARFDSTIVAVNPAWTRLLGWREDDLIGRSFMDLVHPDDAERTRAEALRLAEGRRTLRFENRCRHQDGRYCWLSWTAVPDAGFVHAVGRDVTDEKAAQAALGQAQEALRQSQKMEAVGQLTGGIAHDFNNLLTGIVGSLDLMQSRIRKGRTDGIERYAAAAMSSANRAAALTHRLLAFARRQPLDPRPTDANALVTGMEDLLRRTLNERVRLEIVVAGELWLTQCDPHQLENAILNLAINARDAMPDGGRLTIETANAQLDAGYAGRHADVTPGQYVCVSVTDTGTGMPDDVIAKAFDPFFTTKPFGQGTGLGLSMIYGFARQSDGHAKIESELGRGTSVKLYLPRHHGELEQERAEGPEDASSAHRGETILVVEDDAIVRGLVVESMQGLGCRVIDAADGPSGLALLKTRQHVDLLISDVGLPGLNGRQLADQARERRPGLKVLFITGYAENAMFGNGHLDAGMEMITKPFSVAAFTGRVRRILDRP